MSGTMARQIKTPAERIPSGAMLAVHDGNTADAPCPWANRLHTSPDTASIMGEGLEDVLAAAGQAGHDLHRGGSRLTRDY